MYTRVKATVLTVFAQQCHHRPISAPGDVFHGRAGNLTDRLLLLDIVKNNGRGGTKNEAGSASVEDLIGLNWGLDAFYGRVGEVADFDELKAN